MVIIAKKDILINKQIVFKKGQVINAWRGGDKFVYYKGGRMGETVMRELFVVFKDDPI